MPRFLNFWLEINMQTFVFWRYEIAEKGIFGFYVGNTVDGLVCNKLIQI